MKIFKGKIDKAVKIVVYGVEGIGKSTFAAKFQDALFIDTEGSTDRMEVARMEKPSSWSMLMQQVDFIIQKKPCKTLIIDTADWAEKLCIQHIVQRADLKSIESFGYGKGYVYLEEEFAKLLHRLDDAVESGLNIVVTAHAQIKKFEQPDEIGAYDRFELKLSKKVSPLLREWCDLLIFANYKTIVVDVDGQGLSKGKNKVQGGQRVMFMTHHTCWDAKNRFGLPEETAFDFEEIKHILPNKSDPLNLESKQEKMEEIENYFEDTPFEDVSPENAFENSLNDIPKGLKDLMKINMVTPYEIQQVVASKGYFPEDTPIENYPDDFVNGVLIGAWQQVFGAVETFRETLKF